ncbi:uncharacterized protein LOC107223575 [Neodiprion lecontei]|uniref:Uncharacterized protein LOC107223575 n=1 Tax=Neodiprion lecontei TaxID=441921 RepID=A0A6J0BWT6_NEOLC|nr:uncharacterized protein LOC107223575 [Neodiprion lecontei]
MRLYSEGGDFIPEHFDILQFYGETLLFAWHANKLKVWNYDDAAGDSTPRTILVPGKVECVQSFNERIFVTCSTSGVYKLAKNYQFAVLSKSAIGIGAKFYQVFRLEEGYIYLIDKQEKTSKLLLKHKPKEGVTTRFVGLGDKVDKDLLAVMLEESVGDGEICIFSNGYEIYKIAQNSVKILYSSSSPIVDVVKIEKNEKVTSLLYVTKKNAVILMYAKDNELRFEKVKVNNKVKTAYAIMDEVSENVVWIIYSDGTKTYKIRKVLDNDNLKSVELSEKNITCLCSHGSKILGLTSSGELVTVEARLDEKFNDTDDRDNFFNLKPEMLEEINSIVDETCRKVKELQSIDDKLLEQQNVLKRISMSTCEPNILVPKLRVEKRAKQTVLNCEFGQSMPEKCLFSLSVKCCGRKIFVTKQVAENEKQFELSVPDSMLDHELDVTTDLITLAEEGSSWCLIKNCVKDTAGHQPESQISERKINFLKARLTALQNLKVENNLDIAKLNSIINGVRKEFNVA